MTAINSNSHKSHGAIIVFAGYEPVLFKVDGEENIYDIYKFTLEPYSYINIPISFKSSLKEENIDHPLYFVFISNMNLPGEKNNEAMPFLLTSAIYNLETNKGVGSTPEYTVASYPIRTELEDEIINGIESGFYIGEIAGGGYIRELTMSSDRDNKLVFEAYGKPGDYLSIIIFNDEILSIGANNYIYWTIGEDEMIQYEVELTENIEPGKYSLTSITFPLNIGEGPIFPYSSRLFSLEIDE